MKRLIVYLNTDICVYYYKPPDERFSSDSGQIIFDMIAYTGIPLDDQQLCLSEDSVLDRVSVCE